MCLSTKLISLHHSDKRRLELKSIVSDIDIRSSTDIGSCFRAENSCSVFSAMAWKTNVKLTSNPSDSSPSDDGACSCEQQVSVEGVLDGDSKCPSFLQTFFFLRVSLDLRCNCLGDQNHSFIHYPS